MTTLDPDHGPTKGGTVVTLTGSGFTDGSTVSVDGGPAITPTGVSDDGTTLTFTTPAHTAGGVPVTVTTAGGTSAPLTYTYVAPVVTPPVITDPTDGSTTTTGAPPISGTGDPGSTVTVNEGTTVICTAKVLANGTWTCTPKDPFDSGEHTITATQTNSDGSSDPSAAVTFTVRLGGGADAGDGTSVASNGGSLAYTGSQVTPGLLLAALFLTLGLAVTVGRWRMRRNAA